VEQLLGHSVGEEETIYISSSRIIKQAPPLARRLKIAAEMKACFKEVDKKYEVLDQRELDEVFEEAMRHVRPAYIPE
jgi:hypothetical protein